jgi:signal transduction protein with GAF and PtsI domain
MGFRRISMPSARIGPVKAMARRLNLEELAGLLEELSHSPDASIRQQLRDYAEAHSIPT